MPLQVKWSPEDKAWQITCRDHVLRSFSDKQQVEDYLDKAKYYRERICLYCLELLSPLEEDICANCAEEFWDEDRPDGLSDYEMDEE